MNQLKGELKQDIEQTNKLYRIKKIGDLLKSMSEYIENQFDTLKYVDCEEFEIEDSLISGIIKTIKYDLETLDRYL